MTVLRIEQSSIRMNLVVDLAACIRDLALVFRISCFILTSRNRILRFFQDTFAHSIPCSVKGDIYLCAIEFRESIPELAWPPFSLYPYKEARIPIEKLCPSSPCFSLATITVVHINTFVILCNILSGI